MKTRTLAAGLAMIGAMGIATPNAVAGVWTTVLDAWQLEVDSINSLTTNIGFLNLSGGEATVIQEVDASGNPFVGAEFTELGLIFSANFIAENEPGPGDSGFPAPFDPPLVGLEVAFTGLQGEVTGFDPATGEIRFAFDPGVGSITITGADGGPIVFDVPIASLAVGVPAGGTLSNFGGAIGTLGETTILTVFVSAAPGVSFNDSTGTPLPLDQIALNVSTLNEISAQAGPIVPCAFDPTAVCRSLEIESAGRAVLLRLPEPSVPALLGLGLLAWGVVRRRRT